MAVLLKKGSQFKINSRETVCSIYDDSAELLKGTWYLLDDIKEVSYNEIVRTVEKDETGKIVPHNLKNVPEGYVSEGIRFGRDYLEDLDKEEKNKLDEAINNLFEGKGINLSSNLVRHLVEDIAIKIYLEKGWILVPFFMLLKDMSDENISDNDAYEERLSQLAFIDEFGLKDEVIDFISKVRKHIREEGYQVNNIYARVMDIPNKQDKQAEQDEQDEQDEQKTNFTRLAVMYICEIFLTANSTSGILKSVREGNRIYLKTEGSDYELEVLEEVECREADKSLPE